MAALASNQITNINISNSSALTHNSSNLRTQFVQIAAAGIMLIVTSGANTIIRNACELLRY